jgi:hypothetical protein
VLDVLGMKDWLQTESAQTIAEHLDVALVACDQSSSGQTTDGRRYGPLISTVHFSDTLLAWSPDDSWASFATLCRSVKMIVLVALSKGVPLRGAISVGDVVCNLNTQRFVGKPIADAFLWSEKERPYRSVGVDLTPTVLDDIRAKLTSGPFPTCWDSDDGGTSQQVLTGSLEVSGDWVWHRGSLFLNHWSHGLFVGRHPRQLFLLRDLPVNAEVEAKLVEMEMFFREARTTQRKYDDIASARRFAFLAGILDPAERQTAARRESEEQQKRNLERCEEHLKLEKIKLEREIA